MNESSALSDKQLARAEALKIARTALASSSGFAKSDAADPIDLVQITRFILTGDDPYALNAIARAQSDGAE